MFNNPIGLNAARRQVTGGDKAVQLYGTAIWDAMTYRERFTTKDIVSDMKEYRLADRTAILYIRAFFAYCRAAPNDFSGPGSKLIRQGNTFYLADNRDLIDFQ